METALISIFCCLSGIDLFEATKIILVITIIIVVCSTGTAQREGQGGL